MHYLEIIRRLYALDEITSFGYNETDILQAEKKQCIAFPAVLRSYYLTVGKHPAINQTFNRLLHPETETGFSNDNHFVFYEENQGVVFWGIRKEDMTLDNPPTYGNYDAINLSDEWFLDNETLDNFLLSMALWNGVLGGLPLVANTTSPSDLEKTNFTAIEKRWNELKGITKQNLRFFSNSYSEMIAVTTNEDGVMNGIYVGANDSASFSDVLDFFKMEWDYSVERDE